MQEHKARMPWQWWPRWGQILGLGVILGLLQFLLFTQTEVLEQRFTSTSPELAMIALLYLFIPALAGFLVTRQSETASSGTGAGCLVGGIGFLVIAIPLYLFMILALPPTSWLICFYCQPQPHPYAPFTSGIISTTLILEGIAGAGFGLLGGWLGGLLGPRQTVMSRGRTLLLGVALTLPLILPWMLFLSGVMTSLFPFSLVALPVSALFYLLIPGVEGFLTAQQNEEGGSGSDRGCLVGVFSILAFALATVVLLAAVAHSSYPGPNGGGNGVLAGFLLATFALHALGCIFGGLLGGWLGGLLGRRYRAAASQRSKTAEHAASEAR